MRHAIVIPAFNEARTIRGVAERALAEAALVVVVDDGSTDGTTAALAGLPVVLVRHESNRGKAASLWDGFQAALAAGADTVTTLDGDGQHRPEDLPRLLAAHALYPHRIVIGARTRNRARAPRARRAANRVADFWLSWAAGHPIADSQSGQRLYPAELLLGLSLRHDAGASFTLESEMLIEAARRGYTTVAVPIDVVYLPGVRPSHFRPVRDIARITRMVARHLLEQRMSPRGLWRSLTTRPTIIASDSGSAPDARRPMGAAGGTVSSSKAV